MTRETEPRVVVVGVDDTEFARTVVRHARRHLRPRDEMHLVHVFEPKITELPATYGVVIDLIAVEDDEERRVWERVAADAPPHAERIALTGAPASTLAGYAANVGADLVVVGNRGRGEVRSMVLGSTSHGLIHEATCDVLVVRAEPRRARQPIRHAASQPTRLETA